MKVAITGGHGFLGWHTACRLRARHGVDAVRLGREVMSDPDRLAEALADVDTVLHLAGVNRAETDDEVEDGNVDLAQAVAAGLDGRPVHVVYSNTIHQDQDSPYGRGKRQASEILRSLPGTTADVVLPNLFGEHGRPAYNSFVATFCHEVASGGSPEVHVDRSVPLVHAQGAAQALIDAARQREDATHLVPGEEHTVTEVLGRVRHFHELYSERGELPDLGDPFAVDLFNTYRSYLFPSAFPIEPQVHEDPRGRLFETARSHGGTAQAFVSTTVPGQGRGHHYHLRKVERFFVVRGEAEISLRRLLHDDVVTFRLSGDRPAFVDMPTLWVHALDNVGDDDLITMFWADQLLDPHDPDQYPEEVRPR
ncbi:polysaccharide biosynthesis C-terminal domain-containing protein [Nocardia sp. N13]|uniref:polysaccharide biosynthesis C-terminal domain-containing protein n=1 Tax=Nocardioides sp. N13(2025) TaxID=3453405 RepID=UPI003F76AA65